MPRSNRSATVVVGMAIAVALLASACQWTFARYDSGNTGYNPAEVEVGTGNAAGLHQEWASTSLGSSNLWVPIVTASTAYLAGSTGAPLMAFDRAGLAGCSGTPTTCTPAWTTSGFSGQPFLAKGTLFALGTGGMRAFDPAGITNCAGSPKVCQPLWTASPSVTQPVVVGDVLFGLSASSTLVAYDVNGVINCSGGTARVCTPLRTYAPSCPPTASWCTRVAVSAVGDEVLVTGEVSDGVDFRYGHTLAYDLSGDRSCSGTPVVCTALRNTGRSWQDPVMSQGLVFQINSGGYIQFGFSYSLSVQRQEDGVVVWSASLPSEAVGIAVGEGSVFVALRDRLLTFPIDPAGCTSSCPPSRSAPLAGLALSPPSLANGIVVVGTQAGIETFAADGSVGCSGSPVTCTPIVTLGSGLSFGQVSIAFGNVWGAGGDGKLHAFGLG